MKNTPGQRAALRTPERPTSIEESPAPLPCLQARIKTGQFHCTVLNPDALKSEGVRPETIEEHCLIEGQRRSMKNLQDPDKRLETFRRLAPLIALALVSWTP